MLNDSMRGRGGKKGRQNFPDLEYSSEIENNSRVLRLPYPSARLESSWNPVRG